MGNLYIVDRPFGGNGLKLAERDQDAVIALVQDGVYLDISSIRAAGRKVYAVRRDAERRGLQKRLGEDVRQIDFEELVDLIVANKVINFA